MIVPPVESERWAGYAYSMDSGTRERAYRLRAYPTRAQQRAIGRLIGAARFVWNWALSRRSEAYHADQTRLNWIALSRELTALKRAAETAWLAQLPREPFNQVLRDQERAVTNFFGKRAKYPRFRRRGGKASVRFTLDQRRAQVARGSGKERWAYVELPGLGRVKLRRTEALLGRLRSVTLSRDAACSACGTVNAALKLQKRWQCPACAALHDRDENAARNHRAEGLRVLGTRGSSPATGERPESHARGVACVAEAAWPATVVPFQRCPTVNREPAQSAAGRETRRAPSGTARRRVRAGL